VEAAAESAREQFLKVAEQAGVYKPKEALPLFMQVNAMRDAAEKRLASMPVPTTG